MKKLLVVAMTAALSTAVLAAESQKLTIDVSGAVWGGCAKALATAIGDGGLKVEGSIKPNDGAGPARATATADADADLSAAAAKVNKAETPHRGKKGDDPGLGVVLFAKMDKDSAKKAEDALGKVKGVDKKGTKANAEKGEISVKLAGTDKLTTGDLIKALDGAGVKASISKG